MQRLKSVTPLFVMLLAWSSTARAQTLEAKADLTPNAAVQYWQAFAQMPTFDKDQEKLLAEWNTVSLNDAAVKNLITGSRASLMYLHRGAKMRHCDWGLDYNDGISLMMPHIAKARDLARLAALHARYEFEQGNRKALRDDATAIMTLARHVARDPILISILVGYLIEDVAIDLVSSYVPELKAPYPQALSMYQGLPPGATVQQTVPVEKEFMAAYVIKELTKAEQTKKGSWRELWTGMLGPEAPDALKKVGTLEEAIKLAQDLLPVYDELEKLIALPNNEFDVQYPKFIQKTKTANPLAGVLLPALNKVRSKERRNQARSAMLMAAIAVAQDGPAKLKDIKDPFGDGPFEYRELDNGFELKSKLSVEGEAVTLTVGRRMT